MVTEQQTAAAVARAFMEAWTNQDLETAGTFVSDDVVFDGPLGHVDGKAEYIESLRRLSRNLGVTGVHVLAAHGDATQALIMYDLLTQRFGPLACARLLTLRDGKIATDHLTFDSHPIRGS